MGSKKDVPHRMWRYEEKLEMGKLARQKVKKEFDRNIIVDAYMNEIRKDI